MSLVGSTATTRMTLDELRWNDWENSKQIPVGIFYNCCIYSNLFTIFSKPLQAKLISISTRAVPSQPHLEPEAAIPAVPWRPWHGSSVLEMLLKRNGWVAWTCLKSILKNMDKLVYLLLYGHIWAIYWYIHGFGFQHDPTTQQWFLDVSCVNVWTTSAARTCPFRKPFNHSIAFQSIPEAMAVIQTDSVAGLERLISGS